MPKDPPEEYREQIEKAVRETLEDEKVWALYTNNGYRDEETWPRPRIEVHLQDNFLAESLKGKGTNPVPDTLARLQERATKEYCLKLFNKLRSEGVSREQKSR